MTRNGWSFAAFTVVFLVLGVKLDYSELVALALAGALCLAVAVMWVRTRPRLEVSREVVPPRVAEGDGAAGVITITNVGHRRCPPIVAVEHLAAGIITVPLPALAAGAVHTQSYRVPTGRRGCYTVGPLSISHSDPLRLVSYSSQAGGQTTLFVHPLVHRVSPIPTGRSQDTEGPTSSGAPSGGIAFHSLREYEPGDDVRLIHWRSTARTGNLMVRHTVITNEPRLLIVLDTSADPYDDESFEDAVRVAASLVVAGAEKRFPTEFRTTGGVAARIDATGRGRTDVMDHLALVQRGDQDMGLDALIWLAARRELGVSLGVVTGQASREKANAIGKVRGRFEAVTMVQVGEKFGRPAMAVSGVLGVSADTSADFSRIWKARVG